MTTHCSELELVAMVRGELEGDARAAIELHLDHCAECRKSTADVIRNSRTVSGIARAASSLNTEERGIADEIGRWVGPSAADLTPGTRVGRYEILESLGSGGMACVYAAFDPRLGRRIAVKVLRTPESQATSPQTQVRLIREAQVMARLNHPNVVAVHDVGTCDGQVYVAMDLIEGGTLRDWLRRAPRSRDAILEVFEAAGQGLSAAHMAGVIHGDVKPDNILVGLDGRVCVTDFGLARLHEEAEAVVSTSGTPAYMAPERLKGAEADAASDQYSFCVSLHEALTGARPSAGAQTPGGIGKVIRRGLCAKASERFASMKELLAACQTVRRKKQRRTIAVAVGLVTVVTLGAVFVLRGPDCDLAASVVSNTWNGARSESIKANWLRVGTPFATEAAARVVDVLDSYARAWVTARVDACEATWNRREQSERLFSLRAACLNRRLHSLAALADSLEKSGARSMDKSMSAALQLPSIESCSAENLVETSPANEALSQRLGELKVVYDLGLFAQGVQLANAILADARAQKLKSAEAEALLRLGQFQVRTGKFPDAEKTLVEAIATSESAQTHGITAEAWPDLIFVMGNRAGRIDEARRLLPIATAAVERIKETNEPQISLLLATGAVEHLGGNDNASLAVTERALALARPNSLSAIKASTNAGGTLNRLNRFDEARERLTFALAEGRRVLGVEHPDLAHVENALAVLAGNSGDMTKAKAHVTEAIRLLQGAYGQKHPSLIAPLITLCETHIEGSEDPTSYATCQRSIALAEATHGSHHPHTLRARLAAGRVAQRLGQSKEASAQLRIAVTGWERTDKNSHQLRQPLLAISTLETSLGRTGKAIRYLERAHALPSPAAPSRKDLIAEAHIRFHLARLLVERDRDPARAITLATSALATLKTLPGLKPDGLLGQVETWLARRKSRAAL